jgi:hypothetical protein
LTIAQRVASGTASKRGQVRQDGHTRTHSITSVTSSPAVNPSTSLGSILTTIHSIYGDTRTPRGREKRKRPGDCLTVTRLPLLVVYLDLTWSCLGCRNLAFPKYRVVRQKRPGRSTRTRLCKSSMADSDRAYQFARGASCPSPSVVQEKPSTSPRLPDLSGCTPHTDRPGGRAREPMVGGVGDCDAGRRVVERANGGTERGVERRFKSTSLIVRPQLLDHKLVTTVPAESFSNPRCPDAAVRPNDMTGSGWRMGWRRPCTGDAGGACHIRSLQSTFTLRFEHFPQNPYTIPVAFRAKRRLPIT